METLQLLISLITCNSFGVRKRMRSKMGVSVGLATQKCQLRAFTDFADSLICKKIETCEIGLDC